MKAITRMPGDTAVHFGKAKFRLCIERYLFPLVLCVYPLLWANQGIDVSDPLYSLSNFRFFPDLEGTWAMATYLANLAGYLIMKLPGGGTLLGMNVYTRLLISGMALLSYYFLKHKMPAWEAFLGEVIAISYCWCPSMILYNYLTYVFFLAGSILLYRGLVLGRDRQLLLAGVCLGLNVMVRMPNLLEAVLILAVFFYGHLTGAGARRIWSQVGWCVAGFFIGFGAVYLMTALQYGPTAYFASYADLAGYSATDESYSAFSMVAAIGSAYADTFLWVAILLFCLAAGWLFLRLLPGRLRTAGKVVYVLCIPVLFRLFWGRGMYTYTYYNYRCMYEWGMLLLYLAWLGCAGTILDRRALPGQRLLTLIVLLSVVVTPIGSNNGTMPNLNNLFLAAPCAIWGTCQRFKRLKGTQLAFPAAALTAAVLLMVLFQGIGFRASFSFGDGIYGEKRDAIVENSAILVAMKTREENAEALSGLIGYIEEAEVTGRALITYGNAPGLNYLLDMPYGLTHGWPDLDTYPDESLSRELDALKAGGGELPVVIIYKEDGKLPTDNETKWQAVSAFLADSYRLGYESEAYQVWLAED